MLLLTSWFSHLYVHIMHFVLFFIFDETNSKPGAFWDNQYHERSLGFIRRNMTNLDFILLQKCEYDLLVLSVFGTACSSVCLLLVVACLVHPCCSTWCYCAVSPPALAFSPSTLPPFVQWCKNIYIMGLCVSTFLIFFFFSFLNCVGVFLQVNWFHFTFSFVISCSVAVADFDVLCVAD